MSFHYLTADHIHWNRWTRKHRLKFRKRFRKQHNGQKFTWFITVNEYCIMPLRVGEAINVILHRREPTEEVEKLTPFIKA